MFTSILICSNIKDFNKLVALILSDIRAKEEDDDADQKASKQAMAAIKKGAGASFAMATRLLVLKYRTPSPFAACASSQVRAITAAAVSSLGRPTEIFISHTDKWMQDTSKKSPMQLINEVPPIKVEGRIVACEGDSNPALGHPIEFICLDLDEPAICKYCGLRYVQDHGSHHH